MTELDKSSPIVCMVELGDLCIIVAAGARVPPVGKLDALVGLMTLWRAAEDLNVAAAAPDLFCGGEIVGSCCLGGLP